MNWVIEDWTGKDVFGLEFDSFESAEAYLSEFLNGTYDTDRQEYEISKKGGTQ